MRIVLHAGKRALENLSLSYVGQIIRLLACSSGRTLFSNVLRPYMSHPLTCRNGSGSNFISAPRKSFIRTFVSQCDTWKLARFNQPLTQVCCKLENGITIQVKCEVTVKKTSQDASDARYGVVFFSDLTAYGLASTHQVKFSFSEVLIQWSTHTVKYSFSEVFNQWNPHLVNYSFIQVFI